MSLSTAAALSSPTATVCFGCIVTSAFSTLTPMPSTAAFTFSNVEGGAVFSTDFPPTCRRPGRELDGLALRLHVVGAGLDGGEPDLFRVLLAGVRGDHALALEHPPH